MLIEPACPTRPPSPAPATRGRRGRRPLLPADAPPPAFGRHEPGDGRAARRADRDRRRTARWTARWAAAADDDALAGRRRGRARCAGPSRTVTVGDRQVFVEAFPVRPRLVIVGAVEVAPIARGVREGARLRGRRRRRPGVVRDARAVPADRVDRLVVGWPDEVADEIGLGPDDAVAVLTHDVKFDEPAIVEALRRGCRYVGAVGLEEDPGRPPRAAARGRRDRRGARAAARARSGSTSAAGTRPRRPSRSWPRSSPSGTAAAARRSCDRARAVEAAAVG